jgi:HK97 gp10 family phage protein
VIRTNVHGLEEAMRKLAAIGERGAEIASAELVAAALNVQGDAKRNTPVDTGRLRNSIAVAEGQSEVAALSGTATASTEPAPQIRAGMLTASIGTNVEYGPAIEFGVMGRPPRPFLVPAVEAERPQLLARLRSSLKELER